MAKKPKIESEDQLQLIETDHPEARNLKRLVNNYQRAKGDRQAEKEKEDECRLKVVEKVREIGKPDKLGKIAVSVNGITISIEPDEKVKIKMESAEEDEDGSGDDDSPEGSEPELGSRTK